jgi:hypothetical protein
MTVGEVVLLVVDNALCRIAAHSLAARFPDLKIIVEDHVPRISLVRSRIKRFGLVHAAGQLAFIAFSRTCAVPPPGASRRSSRRRDWSRSGPAEPN